MPFIKPYRLHGLLLSLFLSGCAFHPLGINDEQWQNMSHTEKMQAYQEQSRLDEIRRKERAEAARKEEEARIARQKALEERIRNARFGDIVQCVLEPASSYRKRQWQDAQPVVFELFKGQSEPFRLQTLDGRDGAKFKASFNENGLAVTLCDHYSDRRCATLPATYREFKSGVRRSLKVKDTLKGILRCDYKPLSRRY